MNLILNSVFPVFALIALGSVLKRLKLTDDHFTAVSDKLVYYIFFPALLFWKIGKPASGRIVDWTLIAAVLSAVAVICVASLAYARLTKMPHRWVGSFCQGCYRFSSYVGMAVVLGCLGEPGVREFGVLIGFVIPFINVLAVSTCIWFSENECSGSQRALFLFKAMVSNPLIWACLLGIGYARLGYGFPAFVEGTLSLMTLITLPLALLSVGSSITFTGMRNHTRAALAAAAFKLVALPLVGYGLLWVLSVTGTPFHVAMVYFALPTSPANYILSAQLDSDTDLAVATIVSSTILSIVSISAVVLAIGL